MKNAETTSILCCFSHSSRVVFFGKTMKYLSDSLAVDSGRSFSHVVNLKPFDLTKKPSTSLQILAGLSMKFVKILKIWTANWDLRVVSTGISGCLGNH